MQNVEKYNIGLDIGVGSVGWCITDINNNILKRNGKNMWGSRLFDEAVPAKERRTFRGSRRRNDRRKERINILQSLLQNDVEKKDPNFFPRLRETYKVLEDKTISPLINNKKYNLFSDKEFTDHDYYKKYKTIYHLRNELVNNPQNVTDIRLVYLAIHHIIKYRGNFLYEGDFSVDNNEESAYLNNIKEFLEENYRIELDTEQYKKILEDKELSKSSKKEQIKKIFCKGITKEGQDAILNVTNAILGYKFNLNKIFGELSLEKTDLTFSKEQENESEIQDVLDSYYKVYEALKSMYSWYILQDILKLKDKKNKNISEAFIEKYNKYQQDLKLLKRIYKEYFPSEYNDMFRNINENNYVSYNGKGNTCKKCKPEDFFKKLSNKINALPDTCKEKEVILNDIKDNNFLHKLNTTDNSAIPYQLHKVELEKILNNYSYFPTIAENKEYIMSLLEFRIPYYVGPLSKNNNNHSKTGKKENSWIIRRNDEKIRPWNFDEVVDKDATAEEFILRMTNKCTYILSENVMPKQSLLYSKFCVLNELNNIKVNNKPLSREEKKDLIDLYFHNKKKVTIKDLYNYYNNKNNKVETITGLSNNESFNSNMESYIDMKKIFGTIEDKEEMIENLIYWITIFNDKKILKYKINKEYKEITEEQVNKLLKLKYQGWSRLSRKLLIGLKSYQGDTIIDILEKEKNRNFMQIINDKELGFKQQLEKLLPKVDHKIKYENIDEIPTSPANKRAIWQTIRVINEIIKIMRHKPDNIYIEFARSTDKKELKDTRAKKLLKIYEENKELVDSNVFKELKSNQENKNFNDRMYLYFIQNGKCLYSGKSLDLDNLDKYQIDHILPQSYIKDDSIDNRALVLTEYNQRKKDSLLLDDSIIDKQKSWWKNLLDAGLISTKKFNNLTRREIYKDDEEKFINRQLVETRQITKYVTNLLQSSLGEEVNIYTINASLTHNFREKYAIYKNRNVNNYHHAHDAYIISLIGNTLKANLSEKALKEYKYGEYITNYMKKSEVKENYGRVIGFIDNHIDIEKVKKSLNYKDCFISRMLEEGTGEFYNQNPTSINNKKDVPRFPIKENMPIEKYGGYPSTKKAYSTIYTYKNSKGEKEYKLSCIPIKDSYKIKEGKFTLEDYIKNNYLANKEYTDFKILKEKVLKYQVYLDENKELLMFNSDSEITNAKELLLNNKISEMVYLMNKKELKEDEKNKINYEEIFDYLLEKLHNEYIAYNNVYQQVLEKKDKFNTLENEDKKKTINGLIDVMSHGKGNLKTLELSDSAGRKSNFNQKKLVSLTFIDKSVTGMYEKRYKIYELEKCSNK